MNKNIKNIGLSLIVISSLLSANSFAQIQNINPNVIKNQINKKAILEVKCTSVDLAITSVTITKARVASNGNHYTVSYEIKNLGQHVWVSGGNQIGAIMKVTSSRARYPSVWDTPITANGGYNTVISSFTSPSMSGEQSYAARDPINRTLDIEITFGPDIRNDGNTCNDDKNSPNNKFHIDTQLDEFLRSGETTKTFKQWGPE